MKRLIDEFKKFISKGNVIDMAVGVIIGSAFTAIVNSVVNDLFMPVIQLLTGGLGFTKNAIVLKEGVENVSEDIVINYGAFIAAVINFLLIAVIVFIMVKLINKLRDVAAPVKEQLPTEKECPFCKSKISIQAVRCPNCTSHIIDEKET